MKRKQVAAILLSAIMAVSACVPMNCISAVAAEKDGAENTETSQVVEEPDEVEVPAPEQDMSGEDSSGAEESGAEAPEDEEPAMNNSTGEKAGAQPTREARKDAQPEAAPQDAPEEQASEDAQPEAAAQEAPEATQATQGAPKVAQAAQNAPEATQQEAAQAEQAAQPETEDHTAQPIEEEARQAAGRPALRALQLEDFENAAKITAGDEIDEEAFEENDRVIWKFTPDEPGIYCLKSDPSLTSVYFAFYDADYNEIAHEWDYLEGSFRKGTTYYLMAQLTDPEAKADPAFSAAISLKQLEMPDFYVEGDEQSVLRVPYGEETVLSVSAKSSTGEIYYRWEDESGKIVGTSDSYTFTPVRSTTVICTVSDGPDEETARSEYRVFNVLIENHLVAYPEGSEPGTYEQTKKAPTFSPVTLKTVVQADDVSGLTYEWWEKSADEDARTIVGADTDTYKVASVDHESFYTCVVRDRYNNKKYITFRVYVDNKLTARPEGAGEDEDHAVLYVDYGKPVTLRTIVSALDEDGITYVWFSDDYQAIEGASGKEFTVSSVTESVWYYCNVFDKFGRMAQARFLLNVENHFKAYPEGYEGHDATTIYAKPGSKVKLSAVVEADDLERLETSWCRDDPSVSFYREGQTITVNAENAEYVFTAWDKYGDYKQVRYSIKLSEDIPAVDISKATVTVKDDVYNGTERKPAVRVVYEGRVLTKGTDYTLTYKNNVKAGVRTAKAIMTGDNVTLSGKKEVAFSILPGKTARGDTFNLAGNVKVTWKAVPGARYYKVYREGVTDASESVSEPVIVTTRLVGWDNSAGLVNGHAYRYRIVASLSGGSGSSGDSAQSYSKLMYRLKTVAIKRVKNTEPGKATVWFEKTTSGDSYVIQYGEREDMAGAKTRVITEADVTSCVFSGLKKGKTYYFSIRVRKRTDGVFYYTTFGVAKKVRIER